MEIRNNPSFCGKVTCKRPIQGMEHILTDRVKNAMRVAPTGTRLHFEDFGGDTSFVNIGFYTPASNPVFISGVCDKTIVLTEKDALGIIKTGIQRMKKGITRGWMGTNE